MTAEYAKNEFLYSVDDVQVITRGDIHTVGAKQKGGKTSLIEIFIAAMLCGQWERVKCLVNNMSVLYVDTEMKAIDTQILGKKSAKMANVDVEALEGRLHLVNFRPLTPGEMEVGIRYFICKYKPAIAFIDGIVDLCANFNDVESSQNLVLNFLMKIADEYKCAIVCVLHTNKTDGYTELRGHLGAYLEQKGVTVIKCDKDEEANIVTVKFATHRYAPVPDFHFTFDENGMPISGEAKHSEIETMKQRSKEEQNAAQKEMMYKERSQIVIDIVNSHNGSIERKVLMNEIKQRINKGDSTIKSLLKQMLEEDHPSIIQKESIISTQISLFE